MGVISRSERNRASCHTRHRTSPRGTLVCHGCKCPRNDGFLRGSNAYGNVQNFRCLCGSCHLFRRTDLCRNTDDERPLSRCNSRLIRCAVWCRRTRMGCWLDWLTNRPIDVRSAMHTTKRGEPLPINQALNRPRAKLGLDLSAWMAIVFVTVTVFLVGFRMIAIFSFPMMVGGAWLIVRKHPKMFQLWGLSLNQKILL